MALKPFVPGAQVFPTDTVVGIPTLSALVIDATGEAAAVVFRAPITGTITGIGFRLGAVTTGDTISAELQTTNSLSNVPTDTLFVAGSANSFSLTTTMANSWQMVTLATAATVSAGTKVGLVIKRDDVGGAGNFQVSVLVQSADFETKAAAKVAAWTTTASRIGCIYPVYSGTVVAAVNKYAPFSILNVSLSAGATPDEAGNSINFPFACRATGWQVGFTGSLGTVLKVNLYNTDGTSIMASSRVILLNSAFCTELFESATVLAAGSTYRIAAFVSSGAGTVAHLSLVDVTSIAQLHLGSFCYATSRTNQGAWSDNTAARYNIGLILNQLDDSSASGGTGLAHIIGS